MDGQTDKERISAALLRCVQPGCRSSSKSGVATLLQVFPYQPRVAWPVQPCQAQDGFCRGTPSPGLILVCAGNHPVMGQ